MNAHSFEPNLSSFSTRNPIQLNVILYNINEAVELYVKCTEQRQGKKFIRTFESKERRKVFILFILKEPHHGFLQEKQTNKRDTTDVL